MVVGNLLETLVVMVVLMGFADLVVMIFKHRLLPLVALVWGVTIVGLNVVTPLFLDFLVILPILMALSAGLADNMVILLYSALKLLVEMVTYLDPLQKCMLPPLLIIMVSGYRCNPSYDQ
ncbi:hypothetical protein ACFX2K_028153 [Malus domestica]